MAIGDRGLFRRPQHLGPAYVGAKGIWTQAGQFSTSETTIWCREGLNLAAVPQSATLEYGIEDDGAIFVNGTLVVSDHNGLANGGLVDTGAYLIAGANVIAFTVTDNFAVYGYNHSSWIQIDGVTAAVPEPSTYAMLLLGLAAFGMVRGRSHRKR